MTEPGILASFVLVVVVFVVDFARRGWRLSGSRRAVVSTLATIAITNLNFIFVPMIYLLGTKVQDLYDEVGIPSVPTAFWSGVPALLLALFAIAVYDMANYWNHRAMHMKWLWPVHAIHHSDPDVNGLTLYRVHFLEPLIMWTSYALLVTWLGLPGDAIGQGAILLGLHGVYVHIDRDWNHGPFTLLLASPRFHRWHHANVPEAHGKNLANVIPFYDWMFGTYYNPGPCRAELGADDIPQNDVVALMLWPFRQWPLMVMESMRRLSPRQPVQNSDMDNAPVSR